MKSPLQLLPHRISSSPTVKVLGVHAVFRTGSLLPASSSLFSKHTFLSALWLKILLGSLTARAFSSQVAALRTELAPLELLHPRPALPLPAGAQWFAPVGAPLQSLSAPQSELQPGNREDVEPHRSSPPSAARLSARPSQTPHREFPPSSPGEAPFFSPGAGFTVLPGCPRVAASVQRDSVSYLSHAPFKLSNICTFSFFFNFYFICYHAVY